MFQDYMEGLTEEEYEDLSKQMRSKWQVTISNHGRDITHFFDQKPQFAMSDSGDYLVQGKCTLRIGGRVIAKEIRNFAPAEANLCVLGPEGEDWLAEDDDWQEDAGYADPKD